MDALSFNSLELDFDNFVKTKMLPPLDPNDNPSNKLDHNYIKSDPRHRIIVCQHWLLGLCQVGAECTYLHRFDRTKMPQCKHGKLCKIKNCPLKHGDADVLECIFYKQGFCFNGPMCHRRHVVRPPEDCPTESNFEPAYYASNINPVSGSGPSSNINPIKKIRSTQPNENYKVTLCTHWLQSGSCTFEEGCHFAHGEEEVHDGHQSGTDMMAEAEIYDPTRFRMDNPLKMPFTYQDKISYFLLQAPDLRSLRISKRRSRWSIPYWLRDELNTAYQSSKHVILFFCVRQMRGIYGLARMNGEIPAPIIGNPMSREFPVVWVRTLRISLRTISQMKIASTGMFIGKTLIDARMDTRLGLDLLHIAYRKPEWDWTLEFEKASYIPPSAMNEEFRYFTSPEALALLHPDLLFSEDWQMRVCQNPQVPHVMNNIIFGRSFTGASVLFCPPERSGFVFCSTTKVVEEMLSRGLLALPPDMQSMTVDDASPLFLLDMDQKCIYGIFQADSKLSENIEPTAFTAWLGVGPNGQSPLPFQIRVLVAIRSNPIYLYQPDFIQALGKIHLGGELPLRETKILTNLFAAHAGIIGPNQVLGGFQSNSFNRGGSHQSGGFNPANNPDVGNRFTGYYRPPLKFIDVVPVGINYDFNEIKKRFALIFHIIYCMN